MLQHWVYNIVLMTRSRTTFMVFSPPKYSTFFKQPGYQHLSVSVCENCLSIEGWIHSQRRNRLDHCAEVGWQTRSPTHKPGAEGEFGWHTTWSITVGHRACHRWTRWWERRGTGSLSSSVDCCYSNLLDLLRVKARVCSYNLYATPFFSFPSQLTLLKYIGEID